MNAHKGFQKRLVVCFDGTWNNADDSGAEATNVERIARAVKGLSGDRQQIVLYQRGVGTTGTKAQRLLGGAFGIGVEDNIRSAYQFLAQNYQPARDVDGERVPADEIFIFGFSRGAFAARSLVGLISYSGLLKRQHLDKLSSAWRYYAEDKERSDSEGFCEKSGADCHHRPAIQFLGVWDTVGRLGIPETVLGFQVDQNHTFHDTHPSTIVKNAFHALAVDECRDEFVPTLWTRDPKWPADGPEEPEGCQIDQVWFPGVHSDVGGGYQQRSLADIPLLWMADRAMDCGLDLDNAELAGLLPAPATLDHLSPQHESRFTYSYTDRWTPSLRRICEQDFNPPFLADLVYPADKETGAPLKTIRESIHPSLIKRWSREVGVIYDDSSSRKSNTIYEPLNLAPLVNQGGGQAFVYLRRDPIKAD